MDLKFGDIQETALISLAIKASETARTNARIKDEKAKEIIIQKCLVIYHHLQRNTTRDYVEAVTDIKGRSFDAAFVVYHGKK